MRKKDFTSRIRNAVVLGPPPEDDNKRSMGRTQEAEEAGIMPSVRKLPSQMLVLVLENGDVVFLFAEKTPQGTFEFRWIREESRERTRAGHPGFLMAIDTESRHLALACPEGLLVVYELQSMTRMKEQYAHGQPIKPVLKRHKTNIDADVVQKMDFLYPPHEATHSSSHSILLLIIVQRGYTKMLTYDWMLGDDITNVLHNSSIRPFRLPDEHKTPILLVPIMMASAFLIVSENGIVSCNGVLEGNPEFESVKIEYSDRTDTHHGRNAPLWTAWTRPYRMNIYTAAYDVIYLGREDGVVALLESDRFAIIGVNLTMTKFNCNMTTAFCGVPGRFSDILIIGGEAGPGKLIAVSAFEFLDFREYIILHDMTDQDPSSRPERNTERYHISLTGLRAWIWPLRELGHLQRHQLQSEM